MPDLNRVLRKITRVTPSVFLLVLLWLVFTGSRDLRHKSVSGSGTEGTNWPFFRGEGSRGIAAGSEYPTDWNGTTGKNIEWKIIIPGVGKSSPVIWGDKLFLTSAEDGKCKVLCISKKDCEILWKYQVTRLAGEPEKLPEMDVEAGLAVSTSATNGKQVFSVFANGNLVCLDMDGNLIWSKNIGVPKSSYGYSSSLIIYENILIVQFDSNEKLSLMGFETGTGVLKFETQRTGRPVWSSPVLAEFDHKPVLIINGNPDVTGYDPVSGKKLWSVECMTGDVVPSVAVNRNFVYAVTDYAKLVAIKPGKEASIVWDDNTYTPDVSSPVAYEECLFVATGSGDVACYNQERGDTLWTRYLDCQFYASPVIAGKLLYLPDRSGVMHIVRAEKSFTLVGEPSLGESSDCTPAFSDKKIYIRSSKNLYCISKN
jgi:outer membrane protein assembly factor BamB